MAPVVNRFTLHIVIAGKHPGMLSDNLRLSNDEQLLWVHAQADDSVGEAGRHTVAVVFEGDQAGGRYPFAVFDKAIKRHRLWHQV